MMFTVYTCIMLISWFGAKMIVSDMLTTGTDESSCILYEYSDESDDAFHGICHDFHEYGKCRRIAEVLNETLIFRIRNIRL